MNNENTELDNSVVCKAEDSFMCSVVLDTTTSFVTVVTVSISDAVAPPVLLRIPARPGENRIVFYARNTVSFPTVKVKNGFVANGSYKN